MQEYLPNLKELIGIFIGFVITGLLSYGWSKLKKIKPIQIPAWIVIGLISYAGITFIYLMIVLYEKYKPLKLVQNEKFSYQTVELDGKRFVNCRFDNCKLGINGGREFAIEGVTLISGQCLFLFGKAPSKGLSILMDFKKNPALKPLVNQYLAKLIQTDIVPKEDQPFFAEPDPATNPAPN